MTILNYSGYFYAIVPTLNQVIEVITRRKNGSCIINRVIKKNMPGKFEGTMDKTYSSTDDRSLYDHLPASSNYNIKGVMIFLIS